MPGPTNNPSQQKKRPTKPQNIWQHVSPEEAAGKSDGLSSRRIAADIYVEHLVLNQPIVSKQQDRGPSFHYQYP